jgi:N-methylhydantoinase B
MSTTTAAPSATFDPIVAEVIRRRLEVVCEESAITLARTSGSPILTEAHDFGTGLASADGEVIALSSYLAAHFVSVMNAMRDALSKIDLSTVAPGDHFAGNDPATVAPLHSADPIVLSPIFGDGEVVAWAVCSVHIFDIGGLTPGGWIPGAYDRYGEGFIFPLTKIVSKGRWDETFVDIFLANVRMENSLNDLRSCVASNNIAAARMAELFERYGAQTVRDYAAHNIALSEERARARIAALPDGTYGASDWVEYDGHGVELLERVGVTITVRGDELLIDLSDSPPEANGFVNTTRSALLGLLFSCLARSLFPDLPLNAGLHRPLRIIRSQPGTMLNPSHAAATSCGHMEAGTKVFKAFHKALHKAIGLADAPEIRRRTAGLGGNVGAHNVITGLNDAGFPEMWISFDSLGSGLGAQVTGDGRDTGCYEDLAGARMLDVEMEEEASTLYLYRRLRPNSGGHGFRRGGLTIESAWRLRGMQGAQLTTFSNSTRVPSTAPGGGYPGGATGNVIFPGGIGDGTPTETGERLRTSDVEASGDLLPSHITNLAFSAEDVMQVYMAGGSGLGDPLFREPERVLEDLENELVTADIAETVYGVVLDRNGDGDEEATSARRHQIRSERIGREPTREPAPMEQYRPPLKLDGDQFVCSHCAAPLSPVSENWKDHVHACSSSLPEHAAQLGARLRTPASVALLMWELFCPTCGSLLDVEVAAAGEGLTLDIQLGASREETGERF